jgi:hypothetical protein
MVTAHCSGETFAYLGKVHCVPVLLGVSISSLYMSAFRNALSCFPYLGRETTVPQPWFLSPPKCFAFTMPSYLLYLKQSYFCHLSLYIPRVISVVCS